MLNNAGCTVRKADEPPRMQSGAGPGSHRRAAITREQRNASSPGQILDGPRGFCFLWGRRTTRARSTSTKQRHSGIIREALRGGVLLFIGGGLLGFQGSGRNLLRNGDFEKFNGNDPVGWETTNIPKVLTVVSPSTRSHSGKSAVKCDVKDFYGSKMGGMIQQKKIRIAGTAVELTGHYLLTSAGKDLGYVTLEFHNDDGGTIKICEQNLTSAGDRFISFKLEATVPTSAVNMELKCTLLPGPGSEKLHGGTSVTYDDLQLIAISDAEKPVP